MVNRDSISSNSRSYKSYKQVVLNEMLHIKERFGSVCVQSRYQLTVVLFHIAAYFTKHINLGQIYFGNYHMSMICLPSVQVKKALLRMLKVPFLKIVYTSLQQ